MRLTVKQILAIGDTGALSALANQFNDPMRAFSVLGQFTLDRAWRILGPEIIAAQQRRNVLITKDNSVEVRPGVRQITDPDKLAEFAATVGPMMDEELDLAVNQFRLSDLDGIRLSSVELAALFPLIAE
jgi:hypothetical protein